MSEEIRFFEGDLADAKAGDVIGAAATYGALHELLRAWKAARGLTCLDIDRRGGLQKGYSSKILSPRYIRSLGPQSLGAMLHALGLELRVIAVAPPKPARPKRRVRSRGADVSAQMDPDTPIQSAA